MSAVRQDVRVSHVDTVADGVVRVVLEPVGMHPLLPWTPGAHIDVEIAPGLVRQYSLCGNVTDLDEYRIAVLNAVDGRGGSAGVHRLKVGAEVRVSAPRNNFELRDAARYVFVAGGIGITPLLPMVEEISARGAEWTLFYGGRSRSSMAFVDDLEERHGAHVVIVTEEVEGLLDLSTILVPSPDTLVYCCGPSGLLTAVEQQCAETWPAHTLVVERFTGGEDLSTSPSPSTSPVTGSGAGGDQPVEVQLGRGGPVIDVAADTPILTALIDAGVDIFYSCQEGICGSCETTVLDGTPDHRDILLTPMEHAEGKMLVCVSRATCSRLVLDLEAP